MSSDQFHDIGTLPSLAKMPSLPFRSEGNLVSAEHVRNIVASSASEQNLKSMGRLYDLKSQNREEDLFSAVAGLDFDDQDAIDVVNQAASRLEELGELQSEPTRTLFVRHISPLASESEIRELFQDYGDIRSIYAACRQRGFILVSYYDLRAATGAFQNLQGYVLRGSAIELHFSQPKEEPEEQGLEQGTLVIFNLDPETTNDHLVWLFRKFGDVKSVTESEARPNQKFINFYDVRHAHAALKAMNKAELLGKVPGGGGAGMTGPSLAGPSGGSTGGASGAEGLHLPQASSASLFQLAAQLQLDIQQAQAMGMNSGIPMEAMLALMAQQNLSAQQGMGATHSASPAPKQGQGTSSPTNPAHITSKSSTLSGMDHKGQHAPFNVMDLSAAGRLHISDSASSIVSGPGTQPLLGGGRGPPSTSTTRSVSSGSLQRPLTGSGNMMGLGEGPGSNSEGGMFPEGQFGMTTAEATRQAQQLIASGVLGNNFSAADAAALLQGLGLSSDMSQNFGNWPQQHPLMSSSPGNLGSPIHSNSSSPWPGQMNPTAAASAAATLRSAQAQAQRVPSSLGGAAAAASLNFQAQAAQQQLAFANSLAQAQQIANASLEVSQFLQAAAAANQHQLLGSLGAAGASNLNNPATNAAAAAIAAHLLQSAGLTLPGLMNTGLSGLGVNTSGNKLDRGARDAGSSAARSMGGRLSRRTTDPHAEAERKAQQEKLYALDPEKIMNGEDKRTTIMVKNIPNKYTQRMLLQTFDEYFRGSYDFFYLPIDFKNKCNVGYAFINLREPRNIVPLYERFNDRRWDRFNSEKVCSISYARIQGRAALISHFQNSSLMHEDKRCRPILFKDDEGSAGDPEPFPVGSNVRPRISDSVRR